MINKHDFTDYSDDIELVFVELPRFTKTLEECNGILDNWLFFVKNAGELTVIPKDLPAPVKRAYEASNEAGLTKEELEIQYKKEEYIAINLANAELLEQRTQQTLEAQEQLKQANEQIKQADEQTKQANEKIEQLEQSLEEAALTIARKLKAQGLDLPLIQQTTGLPLDTLEKL